jgi:hypothetical protein
VPAVNVPTVTNTGASRWRALRAVSLVVVLPHGGTDSFDECVRAALAGGDNRASAVAQCRVDAATSDIDPTLELPSLPLAPPASLPLPREAVDQTVTTTTNPQIISQRPDSSSNTSIPLLAGVALGAMALGVGGTLAMSRRVRPSSQQAQSQQALSQQALSQRAQSLPSPTLVAPPTGPTAAPVVGGSATFAPPAVSGATAGGATSDELVSTLIDLSDRVPSQALRVEIIASLAKAGVNAIEPANGDWFDATAMRGVATEVAPDPGWTGRVARTERAGFCDHNAVLRQPEVIVYTDVL